MKYCDKLFIVKEVFQNAFGSAHWLCMLGMHLN